MQLHKTNQKHPGGQQQHPSPHTHHSAQFNSHPKQPVAYVEVPQAPPQYYAQNINNYVGSRQQTTAYIQSGSGSIAQIQENCTTTKKHQQHSSADRTFQNQQNNNRLLPRGTGCQGVAHYQELADDNLHCESIDEETPQTIRVVPVSQLSQGQYNTGSSSLNGHHKAEGQYPQRTNGEHVIAKNQHHMAKGSQEFSNSGDRSNHSNPKVVKKGSNQAKFDIKSIVIASQDGCPSRRTQASRDRSNPSNSSGITASNVTQQHLAQYQHAQHANQVNKSSVTKHNNQDSYSSKHAPTKSYIIPPQTNGGGIFSSFFSQPGGGKAILENEFLTKTIGSTPGASSNQEQQQFKNTIKHPSKKPSGDLNTLKRGEMVRKPSDESKHQQQFHSQKLSSAKGNQLIKSGRLHQQSATGTNSNQQSNTQIIYKSFQQQPNPQSTTHHARIDSTGLSNHGNMGSMTVQGTNPNSQTVSQQFIHTLKTFTQNYYGAQHEKNKKRQPHQNQTVGSNTKHLAKGGSGMNIAQTAGLALTLQQSQHRDNSHEVRQTANLSVIQNPSQKPYQEEIPPTQSRQLKFGQIMDELERFSLSNQNHYQGGEVCLMEVSHRQQLYEDGCGPALETAQSSICESDLEYTQLGNIRASTYKRTQENQEIRMQKIKESRRQVKYKSEERKRDQPTFFTKEYMDNRYINDRVEMELKDFKIEIEKKFEQSKLIDFTFPKIQKPKRQPIPAQFPHQRGHSAEDPQEQFLTTTMGLNKGNVIYKTATEATFKQQQQKSNVNQSIISIQEEDFPPQMIKTHEMRLQQETKPIQMIQIVKKQHDRTVDIPSFNDSLNDIPNNITQDSIVNQEFSSNQHKALKPNIQPGIANKNKPNILLQNFIKQSFDNRVTTSNTVKSGPIAGGHSSTKKGQGSKMINATQDNINFHTFDASLGQGVAATSLKGVVLDSGSRKRNQNHTVVIHNIMPQDIINQTNQAQKHLQPSQTQITEAQIKKAQKQTPKNYSLQLNQVVKKILNESSGQEVDTTHTQMGGNKVLNSASFDQMMYEPSFYTTESYKHGGGTQINHNHSLIQQQHQYFTKDYVQAKHELRGVPNRPTGGQNLVGIISEDNNDDHMLQSYTNVSESNKRLNTRTATSTKKQFKVKRSESNGSQQQKGTLLNKIYRSSKTIKSPQSRQSNMNLNSQNNINLQQQPVLQGRCGDAVRFQKPSQTVNQSNINSTLSSVRQFHVSSKQQPLSHQRQGSSGNRTTKNYQLKGTSDQRLPSQQNKKHQHTLSIVGPQKQNLVNFQTETTGSFHHNHQIAQQISTRGGTSIDKKQPQQLMIKSSQIKRTSGERTGRDSHQPQLAKSFKIANTSAMNIIPQQSYQPHTGLMLDSMMQRSFHNQMLGGSGPGKSSENVSTILQKSNAVNPHLALKTSVASSPLTQHQRNQKKSQSLTSKNTQRGNSGQHTSTNSTAQGSKLVNLGILNQISNPASNGKGGKITYRNNQQRIVTNSNQAISTGGISQNFHLMHNMQPTGYHHQHAGSMQYQSSSGTQQQSAAQIAPGAERHQKVKMMGVDGGANGVHHQRQQTHVQINLGQGLMVRQDIGGTTNGVNPTSKTT